jgi:alginate O-acetyltransferase complex protein AlgI
VIFSSLTFVVFFVTVMGLMLVLRTDRQKKWLLLIASYVFYGAWDWRFLSLIAASSIWSFYFGRRIARTDDRGLRKRYLASALVLDLGLLGTFKYADFFAGSFAQLFGIADGLTLGIVLPVGISFYTFQTMSYTIDIYRRRLDECRSALDFFLFVSFFPQLVAGPIVRASEFLPQLKLPLALRAKNVVLGGQIFVLGLAQKVLVADNVAVFVDPVFKTPELYDAATLWLGLAAYTLQIFCDFSGYSLMAIGVAKVLGFDLPENFRTPYLSRSITEFWRRWHISLSTWLRDYLYISLGGNRDGPRRTDFNLMATMVLGGLWHGAGWNFIIWGSLHGLGLMVHKHWRRHVRTDRLTGASAVAWAAVSWAATLLFAALLWIPFRAADFATAVRFVGGLFSPGGVRWLHTTTLLVLAGMLVWHLLWAVKAKVIRVIPSQDPTAWRPLWTLGALLLLVLMFAPFEASPFIYFQF